LLIKNNDPGVDNSAPTVAKKLHAWLDEIIARRKTQAGSTDDVLNRCLALQAAGLAAMDDVSIQNNLIGLLADAIPTTSKCCPPALDELLKRPTELAQAQEAARNNNDTLLSRYVFEALRFNPNNRGVFRIATQDYLVARGALHATPIPKGTTVLPARQSAMFDERVVDSRNEVRVDRPDYIYMYFGFGLHTCFGEVYGSRPGTRHSEALTSTNRGASRFRRIGGNFNTALPFHPV